MMPRALLLACLSFLIARPGYAQDPMLGSAGLPTLFVLDDTGAEHRGRLIRVDANELVLLVQDQERTFRRDTIRRIQKHGDSLKNGAIAGTLVGAVLSGLSIAIADCPGSGSGGCAGARAAWAVMGVAIYASIGTAIDAAVQGRTLLYDGTRPQSPPQPRRTLAFSIRW